MVDGPPDSVASASKPASSFERAGDRLRLVVELRPGETTIVSWKKLVREATSRKPNVPDPSASCPNPEVNQLPISEPQPSLPSAVTAKPPAENEPKSSEAQQGSNRLSSVIEKIERLYAGNGSSDDEDVVLDDVPDDDEYDTEDSFIDDAELDDYFKVDKSTIKHDGFFVNRGKLERTEPTIATDQQPKKRRRNDGTRGQGGDDGHNLIKQMKMGNKSRRSSSLVEKKLTGQLPNAAASNVHIEASPANVAEVSGKQKSTDAQATSVLSWPRNTDGNRQDKGYDHQGNQLLSSQNNNKQKESSELRDAPVQRSNDRSAHGSKSHSGKRQINGDEQDQTIQLKQKVELSERFDLNAPATKDSLQIMKTPLVARKDGSNVRSRITMMEKAIRELERIVTESRPPSTEVQDTDPSSSQGIKRRLPADIKLKLAKVARLTHDSYGKIPKDVINRLMSIVGHLMQLRTLKRNLKIMANLGLSAKQEKDERLKKIKQEVTEMVKQRILYIQSKFERQMTNSDDFQETSLEGRENLKRKYSMDDALENKICDLYDLYIERIEEYSGPPVKRLYEELAALWPNGVMDIDGIKRAIYKAKNRRKSLSVRRKEQNKVKKVLELKAGDSSRGEAINAQPLLHTREKLLSDSSNGTSPYSHSTVLAVEAPPQAVARLIVPFPSDSNISKQIQEPGTTDAIPKKKVKRKPNPETIEAESLIACPEENHMAMPLL